MLILSMFVNSFPASAVSGGTKGVGVEVNRRNVDGASLGLRQTKQTDGWTMMAIIDWKRLRRSNII